jgi:hypothetical protein
MEHYVTLFDIAFAPQGIALHRSLQRHAAEHTLWALCMDEAVEDLLQKLELPDVRTIRLADAESDELKRVRPGRSRAEYCWTLTPFTFDLVFDRAPDAKRVTYVDADVWLREDPRRIFAYFDRSGAAVQITEHAYAPELDQTATSGRYCVQFLTMDRDGSVPVRRWWQERCVEWCFARFEDGKFGDQKYLDDWPERFGDLVHVATPKSRFQGPWNATRYPYSEATSYHFHGMRIVGPETVFPVSTEYRIPRPHWHNIYEPYLDDLAEAVELFADATGQPPVAQMSPEAALRKHLKDSVLLRIVRRALRVPAAEAPRTVIQLVRSRR